MSDRVKVEAVVGNNVIATEVPRYGSDDWDDFVMSHFKDDELHDGYPTCAGLRRVSRLLLGEVLFTGPTQVFPALDTEGPGRATVVYQVVFKWYSDGSQRVFADVADTWHGNTDDMFAGHAAATASTKAEGRALRKALAIKRVAAEELTKKNVGEIVKQSVKNAPTTGEVNESSSMSENQKNFINSKCKQLNVNPIALGDGVLPAKWTKAFASSLITKLNELQQSKNIPNELVGYLPI